MSSINKVNEFLIKNKLTLTPIKEFQELIKKEKEMPMEYDLFYQNPSNPLELFYIPEIQNIIPYNREQVLIKFDKSKWITLPYNSKLLIFNNNLEKDLLKKFKELCRKATIKISNNPSLRGNKVFEQWERFTKEFKEVEKAKELIKNYEVAYEILDNWLLNVKSKIFKDVNTELFDNIKEIKEQLFDAPVEVKKAFNDVVKYFGACPEDGCIQEDPENKGLWMIISNKTGEPWKSRYESKEKAEEALKAYHASKH